MCRDRKSCLARWFPSEFWLCSLQTFVSVASFVQWLLQHGTYFPDKTQSTEFLRWYLMIVSIYKLQYIWICCQFLSQLLKLIFNVIKTGLNSPPSPWEELIQSCRWKSGISWACCQSLLPLMKLIFYFIENLIDLTSIPMGIDKNLSLKSGNGLGSVHSMGKQTMHVPLTVLV